MSMSMGSLTVGSSPRMRGAQGFIAFALAYVGIIPADAGSTPLISIVVLSREDHPRGCGEHRPRPTSNQSTSGSSPRMRGALCQSSDLYCDTGIIPADAGSTIRLSPVSKPTWDHPRGCGEHNLAGNAEQLASGSSPRMRGAQDRDRQGDSCQGIIPADAGSTVFADDPKSGLRDHPRGCGEHAGVRAFPVQDPGSSPRMRGALDLLVDLGARAGIIPADAGSTSCGIANIVWCRDHPRGCGEHILTNWRHIKHTGSSPRMRGARQ